MYQLDGNVALVTGGGSGIGRAIALRLAREGCDVAILDISSDAASAVIEEIAALGRQAVALIANVTRFDDVDRAVGETVSTLGRLDIMVNNAGVLRLAKIVDTTEEDWELMFRVNVDGVFHGCKAAVPRMIEQGGGTIINMASWTGKIGNSHFGGYGATKAAVIGITQSLAKEVAPHIRVNALCPGIIVHTGLRDEAEEVSRQIGLPSAESRISGIPMGRLGEPEDVAAVAAFMASKESGYMTGQSVNVTGGQWML